MVKVLKFFHLELEAFKMIRHVLPPVYYSLATWLIFLLFNTSFNIMGVNVAEFALSFLNEYAVNILQANLKVLLAWTVFIAGIYLPLEFVLSGKNSRIIFSIITALLLVALLHSIVKYPQLYGEFFYNRYTFLQPVLYFLTDHTSPLLFSVMLYMFALAYMALIFRMEQWLYLLTYLLLFAFLHSNGSTAGLLLLIALFPSFKNRYSGQSTLTKYILVGTGVLLLAGGRIADFSRRLVPPQNSNYNVIILAADSLRFDRIGRKINSASITPNIDKLIKESWNFTDHHVTIPRTFPSWADTLTGKYSMAHKIRDMFPAPDEKNNLGNNPDFKTIGHLLQNLHYRTGVVSGFAGDIFPRADFGFQEVTAPTFNADVLSVQRVVESQLLFLPVLTGSFFGGGGYLPEIRGMPSLGDDSLLEADIDSFLNRNRQHPFFMLFFSSVTHFPYSPPYPYYNQFSSRDYYGIYKYFKFVDPSDSSTPSPAEQQQIRSVFNNSIYAFDATVGKIIASLKNDQLYDNTIIILTGDHGESLYEDIHGHGHGEHLRGDSVTHVPLIIRLPPVLEKKLQVSHGSGREFHGITSSVDLLPTLADIFNIRIQGYPGRSLLKVLDRTDWQDERTVYAETGIWFSDRGDHFFQKQRVHYPNILKLHQVVREENNEIMITSPFYRTAIAFSKHRALLSSNYKFIYIPTNDGIIYEFYDRKIDPLNRTNLYDGSQNSGIFREKLFDLVKLNENARVIGDYLLPPPF